ncbi:hypothetical protein C8J56DRAFT_390433 [Mycena floridula]|nr:hypothetical protein C8J56DRAFT_390433 [Mycena floridula]
MLVDAHRFSSIFWLRRRFGRILFDGSRVPRNSPIRIVSVDGLDKISARGKFPHSLVARFHQRHELAFPVGRHDAQAISFPHKAPLIVISPRSSFWANFEISRALSSQALQFKAPAPVQILQNGLSAVDLPQRPSRSSSFPVVPDFHSNTPSLSLLSGYSLRKCFSR